LFSIECPQHRPNSREQQQTAGDSAGRLSTLILGGGTRGVNVSRWLPNPCVSGAPQTRTASYRYYDDDSLKDVTADGTNYFTYSYDVTGKVTGLAYPASVATSWDEGTPIAWAPLSLSYGYDAAGRPTSMGRSPSTASVATYGQSWNAANMVTDDSASSSVGGGATYSYDSLYRLTAGSYSGLSESFGYDVNGNRTSKTVNGSTTTATYDARDRMTGSSYDSNGNLLSGDGLTNSFDTANRVFRTTKSGVTSEFTYSGDGLRRTKVPDTSQPTVEARSYLWDLSKRTPRVLSDGRNFYVWGLQLLGRIDTTAGDRHVYHDLTGNVRQLANANGSVTASYAYDSFGGLRQSADNDSTYKNEFQYKDEIADAGTGTIYLRARYYDPKSGRFISRDPVAGYTASPQSLNGYAYARSNPVMRSDPTGMNPDDTVTYVTPQGEYTKDFAVYAASRGDPPPGSDSPRNGLEGPRGRVQAVTCNALLQWAGPIGRTVYLGASVSCPADNILWQVLEFQGERCEAWNELLRRCARSSEPIFYRTGCLEGSSQYWRCNVQLTLGRAYYWRIHMTYVVTYWLGQSSGEDFSSWWWIPDSGGIL